MHTIPQRLFGQNPKPTGTYDNGQDVTFHPTVPTPGEPHHGDRKAMPAVIVRPLRSDEADLAETGPMYVIRFEDGVEAHVFDDELTAD